MSRSRLACCFETTIAVPRPLAASQRILSLRIDITNDDDDGLAWLADVIIDATTSELADIDDIAIPDTSVLVNDVASDGDVLDLADDDVTLTWASEVVLTTETSVLGAELERGLSVGAQRPTSTIELEARAVAALLSLTPSCAGCDARASRCVRCEADDVSVGL